MLNYGLQYAYVHNRNYVPWSIEVRYMVSSIHGCGDNEVDNIHAIRAIPDSSNFPNNLCPIRQNTIHHSNTDDTMDRSAKDPNAKDHKYNLHFPNTRVNRSACHENEQGEVQRHNPNPHHQRTLVNIPHHNRGHIDSGLTAYMWQKNVRFFLQVQYHPPGSLYQSNLTKMLCQYYDRACYTRQHPANCSLVQRM